MKPKMVMDSLCIRKRRLPCYFWFILLFGVGGLVLFIHQQDLSDLVQQQGPDMRLGSTLQQPRETLSTQDHKRPNSDVDQGLQAEDSILSSPIPPMQFPHFEKSRHKTTSMPPEQDIGSVQVTKRQRKLLKTSPLNLHNASFSSPSEFSAFSSSSVPSLTSYSSSSASGSAPQESWTKLSNILDARKQLMKENCAKYKSNISKTITRTHVKFLFVEDKYKLLYCQVPKAGCSNWKRTLMVLAGQASNAQSIKHDTVHFEGNIKTLDSFNEDQIKHRLETYKKILFVREPFERVVSAFRDKFENPNEYYHSVYGTAIISKYRMNPSENALKTGSNVTFKEFVQYLLDVHRPLGTDIHWEQANQLCHPCLIDYDLIGKFENMEEESNFLLRQIGAPSSFTLPNFKDRNPRDKRTSMDITEKYFSQVSMAERQRVYDFYYMDYTLFNYSKPFKDLY